MIETNGKRDWAMLITAALLVALCVLQTMRINTLHDEIRTMQTQTRSVQTQNDVLRGYVDFNERIVKEMFRTWPECNGQRPQFPDLSQPPAPNTPHPFPPSTNQSTVR